MAKKRSVSSWVQDQSDQIHRNSRADIFEGGIYEIEVGGELDTQWSEWLGDLTIYHDGAGNTLLTGTIPDQSALHGILGQIRDLGLVLVSLKQVDRNCDKGF